MQETIAKETQDLSHFLLLDVHRNSGEIHCYAGMHKMTYIAVASGITSSRKAWPQCKSTVRVTITYF